MKITKIKNSKSKTINKKGTVKAKTNETEINSSKNELHQFFVKLFKPITKSDLIKYMKIHDKYFPSSQDKSKSKTKYFLSYIAEKYCKKPVEDLTDEDIQNTLNSNYRSLGYAIAKYIHYRDSKDKIPLEQLTLQKIRTRYWDTKNNKWLPIHMHSAYKYDKPNTPLGPYLMDDEDGLDFNHIGDVKTYLNPKNITNPKKVFDTYFIPNGNLIERLINVKNNLIKEIVHKNGLSSNQNITDLPNIKEHQKILDETYGKDEITRKEKYTIRRIDYRLEGLDENGQYSYLCISNETELNYIRNCKFIDIYYWI